MKKKEHIVKTVKPGSIAEELEIAPGDKVLAIDNTEIEDAGREAGRRAVALRDRQGI